MPSFVTQYVELWKRLKGGQRVAIVVAVLATLGLSGALIYYGSQPTYGVLFADLKPADAQAIVDKLKTANVSYSLSDGGTTISVPRERITELRLQMAGTGVLSGGHVGFDIFDRSSFGATDFAQKVNYQRAIEGELARTLEGMDEVESARVHVTRPRESLFADKAERAKASVVLRIRQGRELSRERTESAVNLVASAVEGLDPADISLMDTRGRLLSAPTRMMGGVSDAGAFNTHLEARRKMESETAARVISLLEPVTGTGHVRADVAADLDFSQVEQTEEKYNPQSAVMRSQQTSSEQRNGAAAQGGIAGTRANDPATPLAAPTSPSTPARPGDQRTATTTNWEIDKTVKRTISGGAGRINRLSVSVVVDYKNSNGTSVVRAPEELQKMQEIVAAAVGIDATRGDQIVVQSIPFDQPTLDLTPPTWLERYRARRFDRGALHYSSGTPRAAPRQPEWGRARAAGCCIRHRQQWCFIHECIGGAFRLAAK
ncbi:MAG: flagellar basal-body MS-ring/collar protein FliF [Pyrinomonadaceae bacterium]